LASKAGVLVAESDAGLGEFAGVGTEAGLSHEKAQKAQKNLPTERSAK
jgi:hypothetical protein